MTFAWLTTLVSSADVRDKRLFLFSVFFYHHSTIVRILSLHFCGLLTAEYCYGGHPLSYSGIFAMAPQDVETLGPNYSYKSTIEVGHTDFTEADIALILEDMGPQYRGDQYHLLRRNCNHFSDAFIQV
ncbi:PPPDE peptidase domain-containing protein 1, partial [Clonorchis sinensis]